MKSMTCAQMGGPCDAKITGNTAEEMMKNGGDHVNQMAGTGDEGHKQAQQMMEDTGKDPVANAAWIANFKKDFDALPEE